MEILKIQYKINIDHYIEQWTEVVYLNVHMEITINTAIEYLFKIISSRYGLCIRGYGEKCHRSGLMAVGTIPIVTNDVNTHLIWNH